MDTLIAIRGEEDEVEYEIMGLDEFDIQALDAKLQLVAGFVSLPVSDTAKKWVLGDLSQSMAADAPPEVKERIRQESEMEAQPTGPATASPAALPIPGVPGPKVVMSGKVVAPVPGKQDFPELTPVMSIPYRAGKATHEFRKTMKE
jgi:hypothetical protein